MKTVWIVATDEDYYYEEREFFIEIFDTYESAMNYKEIVFKNYVDKIREEYKEETDDLLEIKHYKGNLSVLVHVEDYCDIYIEVKEYPIMSMSIN